MDLRPHIEKFAVRMAEVEQELGDPKVFENNRRAQELGREYARLKNLVALGERLLKAGRAGGKPRLGRRRRCRNGRYGGGGNLLEEEIPRLEKEVQFGLVPPDSTDSRNTIVEIRAGAGGDEAALFVGDLYRMYTHFATAQGWSHELMESNAAEMGGFREVIFALNGEEVYKLMKFESGVHRVQRAGHGSQWSYPYQHGDRGGAARGRGSGCGD